MQPVVPRGCSRGQRSFSSTEKLHAVPPLPHLWLRPAAAASLGVGAASFVCGNAPEKE